MESLVALSEADGLRIRLAYATSRNWMGRALYAPSARCVLRPEAAARVRRAAAGARRAGLVLVVFDAYRPEAVQRVFWNRLPDDRYVADPAVGSNHTRGAAADVGLAGEDGRLLDMGTGFDAMCEQSHHDRRDLSQAVERNRDVLLGIMLHAGLVELPTEWWHYELADARNWPLIPADAAVPLAVTANGSRRSASAAG
ncbi:MAG TPA: D-alanyl-D-alanine dipeptidase [Nevskiaceae bacterium]